MLQNESGTNQTEGSVMDNKLNICVAWNIFFSNFVYKMKKKTLFWYIHSNTTIIIFRSLRGHLFLLEIWYAVWLLIVS